MLGIPYCSYQGLGTSPLGTIIVYHFLRKKAIGKMHKILWNDLCGLRFCPAARRGVSTSPIFVIYLKIRVRNYVLICTCLNEEIPCHRTLNFLKGLFVRTISPKSIKCFS